jgi:hypothetical protein
MFKASKELVGKEDKYVNGYGPQSDEEEVNEEEFLDLFIKNENTIEEGIDELSENLDNLKKDIEESNKIKKELDDETDEIDKLMDKLEKLINEEEQDVERDTKLIGGNYDPDTDPLLNKKKGKLFRPNREDSNIRNIMYELIRNYGERHYEITELINNLRPLVKTAKEKGDAYFKTKHYKELKYKQDNVVRLPYNAKDTLPYFNSMDENYIMYYKRAIKEEEEKLKDFKEASSPDSSESEERYAKKIDKLNKKLKIIEDEYNIIEDQINEKKREKYKDYNQNNPKLEQYEKYGVKAYENLIKKLIEKYDFLDSYPGKQELQKGNLTKKYSGQYRDVKSRVTAVLDLLQIVDKNKLNEISKEGNDARELYYQLIQSKLDTDHTRVSSNPTKREDGTRSEVLFKRFMLDKYPKYKNNDLINFNQYTFYDSIDFDLPDKLVELKMSIDKDGDKKWLYVDRAKVNELLKKSTPSKPAKLYWYNSPHEGYLANMDKATFDGITFDNYRKNLYRLKGDLTDEDFKESDLDKPRDAYRLELEPNRDPRITKVKSKL